MTTCLVGKGAGPRQPLRGDGRLACFPYHPSARMPGVFGLVTKGAMVQQ
jgi:hypothetical protein